MRDIATNDNITRSHILIITFAGYMKNFLLTLVLGITAVSNAFADDGYTIKLHFNDVKNQGLFLAHYYGKPLPTIYKIDSTVVDSKGNATLQTDRAILGGLYLVVLNDNSGYFEFLLNNGDELNIDITKSELPGSVKFAKSAENNRFVKYITYLNDIGKQHQNLIKQYSIAKTKADSMKIQDKMKALGSEVSNFRNTYIQQYKGTQLSNVFKALEMPPVPESITDQQAVFNYYKAHYWDNFDFNDPRLVYTPMLDTKLEEYFTKMVVAIPDTFNKEVDWLLAKARASDEVFKYIAHWLVTFTKESDIMGMDATFVHLIENYYMKGDAYWLNQGTLEKYIDRARSIAPNVLGNIAPDIAMMDLAGRKLSLHKAKADYVLLTFWSPDCGHCKEEIPRVDSVYRALGLDKKGVKLIAFNVDNDTTNWAGMVKDLKLGDWLHVHDPERVSGYRAKYDVYGTPKIYLLDERKIIRGKNLDHSNIEQVMRILEEEKS